MLSATLTPPSLPGGAYFVNVNGTNFSDVINVQVSAAFFGYVVTVTENLTTSGSWFVPAGNHFAVQVWGNGGDDSVTVKAGTESTVHVDGGEGNDAVTLNGSAPGFLHGGNGNDVLNGGPGADGLYGEGGSDVLRGNAGNDTLYAGGGNLLSPDRASDRELLDGGDGRDVLFGSALGSNTMYGGRGNDDLYGGRGNDFLDGGPGPLRFFGLTTDADSDLLEGFGGNDTADYSSHADKLNVSLDDVRNDGAAGEFDNVVDCEVVVGGSNDDTFSGKHPATYFGGPGRDTYNLVNGVADTIFDDVTTSVLHTDGSIDFINPGPRRVPTPV